MYNIFPCVLPGSPLRLSVPSTYMHTYGFQFLHVNHVLRWYGKFTVAAEEVQLDSQLQSSMPKWKRILACQDKCDIFIVPG